MPFHQKEINVFDIVNKTSNIELYNKSNVVDFYEPEIKITLTGSNTGISLTNLSDGGRIFGFTSLSIGEILTVDNKLKKIVSSTNNARIGKLIDKNWLKLIYGKNILKVSNECKISVTSQYPLYI